jgi:hypothetical protein
MYKKVKDIIKKEGNMTNQCEYAEINENKYTEHMKCSFKGECRHQNEYVHEVYCTLYVNPPKERTLIASELEKGAGI